MKVIAPNIANIKPVKVIIILPIISASLSTLYWLFYNHVRLGHNKHNMERLALMFRICFFRRAFLVLLYVSYPY